MESYISVVKPDACDEIIDYASISDLTFGQVIDRVTDLNIGIRIGNTILKMYSGKIAGSTKLKFLDSNKSLYKVISRTVRFSHHTDLSGYIDDYLLGAAILSGIDSFDDESISKAIINLEEGSKNIPVGTYSLELPTAYMKELIIVKETNAINDYIAIDKMGKNYILGHYKRDGCESPRQMYIYKLTGEPQFQMEELSSKEILSGILMVPRKCSYLTLADNTTLVISGDTEIKGKDGNPAINPLGNIRIEYTGTEPITLILEAGSHSSCIGGHINYPQSYNRWESNPPDFEKKVITIAGKMNVHCIPSVAHMSLGTFGWNEQPEVILEDGATIDCSEFGKERIMVSAGEWHDGSTKRTGYPVYEIKEKTKVATTHEF